MLLSKAAKIEHGIDTYLGNVLKASLIFDKGIRSYFEGDYDSFSRRVAEISTLEHESDNLRREIKLTLYKELLIPDSRGDVLGLLENIDNVIDWAKKVLVHISIEKPQVWPELKQDFISLSDVATNCVEELVKASRAFFTNIADVPDALVKVHFLEHEADELEARIMKKAFSGEFITDLCQKTHVRYFAERISRIADEAEAVAERLEIYTIKRGL